MHTHTITSKYNIGDTVWGLSGYAAKQYTIKAIMVRFSAGKQYVVEYTFEGDVSWGFLGTPEKHCFATREELIASL